MKSQLILSTVLSFLLGACQNNKSKELVSADIPVKVESSIEKGKYLVEIMDCASCHSPKVFSPNGPVPDPSRLFGGYDGSQPFPELSDSEKEIAKKWVLFYPDLTAAVGPWGVSFAGNISSSDTGIGTWSLAQFKKALTEGKFKGIENSRTLLPPMPWQAYKALIDDDIKAIYDYLKSTEPVDNIVPPPMQNF